MCFWDVNYHTKKQAIAGPSPTCESALGESEWGYVIIAVLMYMTDVMLIQVPYGSLGIIIFERKVCWLHME
jgi:hypothetical protein